MAGRAFGIKFWGGSLSHFHLCDCCKPASGHTVRGESKRVAATNQVKVKVEEGHTPKERRRGAYLPFIGR